MLLDHFISELLFHHDCVIVPGLGGFVVNYRSARISEVQSTFYPPSKSISFNKNLRNNDGLLANHVAAKTGKDYSTVSRLIEEEVLKINSALKQKQKWVLDQVGTLYLDSNFSILFEPQTDINYLIESYGLTVFQKQPIVRVSLDEKLVKELKDKTVPFVQQKSSIRKWAVAAAITIPIALFAIWLPGKLGVGPQINYADLNPFAEKPAAVYQPNTDSLAIKVPVQKSISQQLLTAGENDVFVEVSLEEGLRPLIVRLKERSVAEPVSTYVASSGDKSLHYHIVGGCFSSQENAQNLVNKLQAEGFNASIIGKRKGLWTVSYNSFVTRKEATAALASAKAHNEKAWILNY